jgi:transposase-like protein
LADGLRDDGLTTQREELRRLRREVRNLREEREILSTAGALHDRILAASLGTGFGLKVRWALGAAGS